MSVLTFTDSNYEEEVLKSDKTVLIDFYADWCGPCKMISPILEEVEKEENIEVVKVNVDDLQNLAKQFGVMTIPNLKLFEKGMLKNENVGLMSKEEVKNFIK
jgi:thioredoxin 1